MKEKEKSVPHQKSGLPARREKLSLEAGLSLVSLAVRIVVMSLDLNL